ncbi:MAG: MBL fold metallo-hydrolase, partial [Acidimicrobiia bacterium]|nr:MBL fold metallo-hydrolase [Acidimicrobiia bacterium]
MSRIDHVRARVAARLLERLGKRALSSPPEERLPDGLHVFVSGAGSPMPDPLRAGPGVGVLAGDRAFVFDTGAGSISNLQRMRFPIALVDAVVITHLHSDHIDGLGEMLLQSWIRGSRTTPTPVYGPTGIGQVVDGFNLAYQVDSVYRFDHHGDDIADLAGFGGQAHQIELEGDSAVLIEEGDLRVTVFAVHHHPVDPAFGFRIDYRGRSVTISGDTVYHPGLVTAAEGTDLLLHDALSVEMAEILRRVNEQAGLTRLSQILRDIQDYHATPVDAARAARDAHVRSLVL